MGGMDIFPPEPVTVDLGGGLTVSVSPIPMRHMRRYLAAAAQILPFVAAGQWVQGMAEAEEAFLDVAEIGAGVPRDQVAALNGAQIVRLIGQILVVNADFFLHRLAPEVQAITEALAAASGGPAPSHGLSSAGTDTATSLN